MENSYNYLRGIEALEQYNTEEALEYFGKEILDNPDNVSILQLESFFG